MKETADALHPVVLYGLCVVGSLALYIVNRTGGQQPFSIFKALEVEFTKGKGMPFLILFDLVISSALGGAIVYFVSMPTSTAQAIIAGLGMTAVLSVHIKER